MSLEALERSDLSRLPGGIFTRAFIRAYAQEVGLDPDRTIQDFIAELPPESAAATAHPAAVEDPEKLESDRKAVATAIRLVMVSLPIAVVVIYYGIHHRSPAVRVPDAVVETADSTLTAPDSAPASPESAVPSVASTGAPPASSSAPPPPVQAAAAHPSGLTMEIAPTADCWVSATADGEPTFSGLMHAGDKRQISAREEISLNVGDAGAFSYKLNGKDGRPLGARGEVVSRRIKVADLKDYLTP